MATVWVLLSSTHTWAKFKEDAIKLRKLYVEPFIPSIPSDIPIDNRHLICETFIATFHLGPLQSRQETYWKRSPEGLVISKELTIVEAAILDDAKNVIGKVIPTD